MDRTGKHLGIVLTGDKHVTNLCFGGEDWTTLFLTTFNEVGRMPVKIPGIPVPRGAL